MTPSSRKLRIRLLGPFTVEVDGITVEARQWRLRKARLLLAMLALAPGQRRHREQVLDRSTPGVVEAASHRVGIPVSTAEGDQARPCS